MSPLRQYKFKSYIVKSVMMHYINIMKIICQYKIKFI